MHCLNRQLHSLVNYVLNQDVPAMYFFIYNWTIEHNCKKIKKTKTKLYKSKQQNFLKYIQPLVQKYLTAQLLSIIKTCGKTWISECCLWKNSLKVFYSRICRVCSFDLSNCSQDFVRVIFQKAQEGLVISGVLSFVCLFHCFEAQLYVFKTQNTQRAPVSGNKNTCRVEIKEQLLILVTKIFTTVWIVLGVTY